MTDEDTERTEQLRLKLWDMEARAGGSLAKAIMANLRELMDVLVEAGVMRMDYQIGEYLWKLVEPKPPHVHEWRVAMDADMVGANVSTTVRLICHGCREVTYAANRCPIEGPDDAD
jgi:hypothetical protein